AREEGAQAGGEGGEEGLGQGQRQARELAVGGACLDAQLVTLQGFGDGTSSGALVAGQGVGEDTDEFGEGGSVLVASAAVCVEEPAQDTVRGEVAPQGVEGLGQRQLGQDFKGEAVFGDVLAGRQHHGSVLIVSSGSLILSSAQLCK